MSLLPMLAIHCSARLTWIGFLQQSTVSGRHLHSGQSSGRHSPGREIILDALDNELDKVTVSVDQHGDEQIALQTYNIMSQMWGGGGK